MNEKSEWAPPDDHVGHDEKPLIGSFGRIKGLVQRGYVAAMSATELRVWLVLQSYSRKSGLTFPGTERIAREAGVSRSHVSEALSSLRQRKLWKPAPMETSKGGRGRTSKRIMLIPPLVEAPFSARATRKTGPSGGTVSEITAPSVGPLNGGETAPALGTVSETPQPETVPSAVQKQSQNPRTNSPGGGEKTVPASGDRTDKEEIYEQTSNSTAAADGDVARSVDADEAAAARGLLASEGVSRKVAAELVADKGPQALAAVRHAIGRADAQESRGVISRRSGFIVELVRAYEPPAAAAGYLLRKRSPEQAMAEARAEQAERQARRKADEQAVEADSQANWRRLAALSPERYRQLEALAKANLPFATGDLKSSPWLQAQAIAELDQEEAQDEVAA